MIFLTLTDAKTKRLIAVRCDDVRVLEDVEREDFVDGEWKPSTLPATLVKLVDGSSYTVAEPAADLLKKLENPS